MTLQTLTILSCVLTTITMVIFTGFIAFLLRFGGQGVQSVWNRIFNRGDDDNQDSPRKREFQSQSVSSGSALRQRAKELDFAPAPTGQYDAQSASGGIRGVCPRPVLPSQKTPVPPGGTLFHMDPSPRSVSKWYLTSIPPFNFGKRRNLSPF